MYRTVVYNKPAWDGCGGKFQSLKQDCMAGTTLKNRDFHLINHSRIEIITVQGSEKYEEVT